MSTCVSGEPQAVRAALAAGWCELEAEDLGGCTAFLGACNQGHAECMQLLVEAGCETAASDKDNANALMHAAVSGEPKAVRAALAAGWCGLEARDLGGSTAFLGACNKGHAECMQLLAEAGCDTAETDNRGTNALIHAAFSGKPKAVRAALAAGWCSNELEARNTDGCTAFLLACNQGHLECMRVLAEAGCNTAATDNKRVNALVHAVISRVPEAVRTALAAGWCELEDTNHYGDTAFLYACRGRSLEFIQVLEEAGCDTAARNSVDGSNAMGLARACGNTAAVQWLRELTAKRRAAALQQEARKLLASGKLLEAQSVTEKAAYLLPESTALAHLRDEIQRALAQHYADREHRAQIAEAELMAMLGGNSATADESMMQKQKAQRKKEKRRRQQQAKREAEACRTEDMSDPEPGLGPANVPEPEPEPEPELDPQPVVLSPAAPAPTSPAIDPDEAASPGACVRTPPDEFCCPITSECMRDPVFVVATGLSLSLSLCLCLCLSLSVSLSLQFDLSSSLSALRSLCVYRHDIRARGHCRVVRFPRHRPEHRP